MASDTTFFAKVEAYIAPWRGHFEGHCFLVRTAIVGYQYARLRYGKSSGASLAQDAKDCVWNIPGTAVCEEDAVDAFSFLWCSQEPVTHEYLEDLLTEHSKAFEQRYVETFPDCGIGIIFGICEILVGNVEEADVSARLACMETHRARSQARTFNSIAFHEHALERKRETHIRSALQAESFTFLLQPKVNIRTGEIIGAEALVRGVGESGNIVPPIEFLPAMERNGLILELDLLVLKKVCVYLAERIQKNLPVVPTSVNLSRLHIYDPRAAEKIDDIIQQYQIPRNLVEFELTETIFVDEFKGVRRLISQLHADGYRVSIDDFGAGYAGMGVWQELDFDTLKLDRTFLSEDEALKEKNAVILPNIIDIAQRLHVNVICEGVETAEQCQSLSELGCDLVQGYYYSKPVTAYEFYDVYEQRSGRLKPAVSPLLSEHIESKPVVESIKPRISRKEPSVPPRLIALIALICVVTAAAAFFFNRGVTESIFSDSVSNSMETFAGSHASTVDAKIANIANTLESFSALMGKYGATESADEYLEILAANNENTDFFYTSDEALRTDKHIAPDKIDILRTIPRGELFISDSTSDINRIGEDRIAIGTPVYENDAFRGMLWALVNTQQLITTQGYSSPYGEIKTVFLIDGNGSLLAQNGESLDEITGFEASAHDNIKKLKEESGTAHIGKIDGVTHYISVMPLNHDDWRVGFVFNASKADVIAGHTVTIAMVNVILVALVAASCAAILFIHLNRRRKKELLEQERYHLLENFSDTVMFEYDPAIDTIRFTPNAGDLIRVSENNNGSHLKSLATRTDIHPADKALLASVLKGEGPCNPPEARIRAKSPHSDEYRWLLIQYRYLSVEGKLASVVGKISDIDAQHLEFERISRMARRDGLTGLYNKTTAEKLVRQYSAEDAAGVLYIVDLDNFKRINDRYGHIAGDTIMRIMGSCLVELFHKSDVVGRIGGDEFIVYLRGSITPHAAVRIIEDFWKTLCERLKDSDFTVSLSVGATLLEAGEGFESLFSRADKELYRAKHDGRQRLSIDGEIFAFPPRSICAHKPPRRNS